MPRFARPLSLEQKVRVAAVDVEKANPLARALEQSYQFQVKGVPTIIILKPQANGSKKRIDYQGPRTASGMMKELLPLMPDHSQYVTTASLPKFIGRALPKAVLFSSKSDTPPIWKALSTKYRGRMVFGLVPESNKDLAAKFAVNCKLVERPPAPSDAFCPL